MTPNVKNIFRPTRTSLSEMAMYAASKTRQQAGLDQHRPICVYDLCQRMGVTVLFNDLDMEGMYQKAKRPIIHLSAKRPLARRAFNCGHELGHHVFGHGSTIDELTDRSQLKSWDNPEEFLADTFSAHLLMPTIGVRGAFNRRQIDVASATPAQLFTVACEFGVGYQTLITHLSVGLHSLTIQRADELKRSSPKSIRQGLLEKQRSSHLVIAGPRSNSSKIDLEVGSHLLVPLHTFVDVEKLVPLGRVRNGSIFLAQSPGTTSLTSKNWRVQIRISRAQFVGLAKYRHLEEAA